LAYYQHKNHPTGARLSGHSVNAVIRVVKNNKPIAVFFGDLDQLGLTELCTAGMDLLTPVAVFPHHGGGTGTAAIRAFAGQLCTVVHPEAVVFSIGRGVHDTPDPEILAAILEQAPNARVICTQLSVHCANSVPNQEPPHLTPTFARGRERRLCCAGSILIDLYNFQITPLDEEHQAFINEYALTALCRNHPSVS
jgi:competence protein ComEC